jgi:hypothetical protein
LHLEIPLFFKQFNDFWVDEGCFLVGPIRVDKVMRNPLGGRKLEAVNASVAKTAPVFNQFGRQTIVRGNIPS